MLLLLNIFLCFPFLGLNYEIALPGFAIDDSVLFIGLGMNHPAGGLGGDKRGENVSILGCAANDGEHAGEYFGNFFVQPQFRDEKVSVLFCFTSFHYNRFSSLFSMKCLKKS